MTKAPAPPSDEVPTIWLTPSELASKKLGSHNLQAAVEALHRDGLVVLANAVSPGHLDELNARMVRDAAALYARPSTHRNFGAGTGNIQQEPAAGPGLVFSDVVANPWAADAVQCMLGPGPRLRFYSANTVFRTGAQARQPPHVDVGFDFLRVPFGYCVNNGSTEVWLGTHDHADGAGAADPETGRIRAELLEARRAVRPPVQPRLPKGSLVIRDFRLWHAGMPNRTDEPRVMLVSVLFPRWYRSELKMRLPESVRGTVDWGEVVPCVEWMPDGWDYLQGAHDHDFALLP
ncbi:hypothetical protein F4775DRAFT_600878 [Biscogniauxia sp. FL1348]|nr:hypothetical protein F4775DRAFT_600878 [Biscogniauxia sp. FL1348]